MARRLCRSPLHWPLTLRPRLRRLIWFQVHRRPIVIRRNRPTCQRIRCNRSNRSAATLPTLTMLRSPWLHLWTMLCNSQLGRPKTLTRLSLPNTFRRDTNSTRIRALATNRTDHDASVRISRPLLAIQRHRRAILDHFRFNINFRTHNKLHRKRFHCNHSPRRLISCQPILLLCRIFIRIIRSREAQRIFLHHKFSPSQRNHSYNLNNSCRSIINHHHHYHNKRIFIKHRIMFNTRPIWFSPAVAAA